MKDMRVSKMESDNMMTWLGTGIAQRRESTGLTCRQLASKVHLKTDVIHRLELGEYELSVRELYTIVRALGLTLREMFP
jgi:ribosome-binding protein aMBF1 (putative translation factor)